MPADAALDAHIMVQIWQKVLGGEVEQATDDVSMSLGALSNYSPSEDLPASSSPIRPVAQNFLPNLPAGNGGSALLQPTSSDLQVILESAIQFPIIEVR